MMDAYGDMFADNSTVGDIKTVATQGCCMILDYSALAMQSLAGLSSSRMSNSLGSMMSKDQIYMYENENNFILWSDGFLSRLTSTIMALKPSMIIVAIDCDGKNWRKDIYDDYKFGRKGRQSSLNCVDWEIFSVAKKRMLEFLKNLGLLIVGAPRTEADDVIYCIARTIGNKNAVVVSTDGDMLQLGKWGTKIYNPVQLKFVEELDPAYYLEFKVMIGDSSDFIHSIRGSLTDKKAVWPSTLIKKAESVGVLAYLLENEEDNKMVTMKLPSGDVSMRMSDVYIRNRRLIDMEYIPNEIIELIMDEWRAAASSISINMEEAMLYNKRYAEMITRILRAY